MIYRDEFAEFSGTASSISGVAVYDCTIENDFSADIGGVDGPTCTGVELLYVDLDGYHLSNDAVVQIAGKAAIARAESAIGELIEANIGEYAEAA